MNWLLQSSQGSATVLRWVLPLAALLFLPWLFRRVARLLRPSSSSGRDATSKQVATSSESGFEPSTVPQYSAAVVGRQPQDSAAFGGAPGAAVQAGGEPASVVSEYQENPSPTAIVAEVCSLQSPAREGVEESYRGMRVRWKLRLTGLSEREQAGAMHTVRMSPTTQSAFAAAVYFGVSLDEHPELQTAEKNEIFVVEGTIANIEDLDIDLKDVRTVRKAA